MEKYLDFCHRCKTNILGYSNTYIDNKVKKVVSKGNGHIKLFEKLSLLKLVICII